MFQDEKLLNINYISSFNFRISRTIENCSNCIIEDILNRKINSVYNTLIASPPGLGKTTLLKDIIKRISNGLEGFNGITVTVIDERGEIGASYKGVMQNDLGIRTDIFDNIPKAVGIKMAIRSMAPKVIVADEIGTKEDVDAIRYLKRCGVKGIFTAHAYSLLDLKNNPMLKELIDEKIFERIILIKSRKKSLIEKEIYSF